MLRHLQIGDEMIAPQAWQGRNAVSAPRRHSLAAFRLGGVCLDCNNGWMSNLERRSKPVLLPLSKGDRSVLDLSHSEQRTISHWSVKTALVLHAASYRTLMIPRLTYMLARNARTKHPPGVSVFAMQTPDLAEDITTLTAIQSDRFLLLRRPSTEAIFPRWKVSLRIGTLQLLVVYCSDPSWKPVGWLKVHVPLSPTQLNLSYTAGLRHDRVSVRKESGTALFHISLGLAHGLIQSDISLLPRPPLEVELESFFSSVDAISGDRLGTASERV